MPRRHCHLNLDSSLKNQLLRSLILPLDQHLLGFGDGLCRVQSFGTGLRAIHDRVATVQTERIFKFIESFAGRIITTVNQPAIRCQQRGRSQIAITIPPVAWATGRTTGTENAGGRFVDEFLIFLALQPFLIWWWRRSGLQPRFDRRVLRVEIGEVCYQVFDNRQMCGNG